MKFLNRKGVSLPEVIVAAFIMALAVGSMMSFYVMGQRVWKEGDARADIQMQSRLAMDKMVRGESGTDGIREATSVTIPSSSAIRYVSGIDAVERSFYLLGDDVMYDPDVGTGGDEYSIAWDVRTDPAGLIFTVSGSVVTISLYMEKQVGERTMDASLSTKVHLRN